MSNKEYLEPEDELDCKSYCTSVLVCLSLCTRVYIHAVIDEYGRPTYQAAPLEDTNEKIDILSGDPQLLVSTKHCTDEAWKCLPYNASASPPATLACSPAAVEKWKGAQGLITATASAATPTAGEKRTLAQRVSTLTPLERDLTSIVAWHLTTHPAYGDIAHVTSLVPTWNPNLTRHTLGRELAEDEEPPAEIIGVESETPIAFDLVTMPSEGANAFNAYTCSIPRHILKSPAALDMLISTDAWERFSSPFNALQYRYEDIESGKVFSELTGGLNPAEFRGETDAVDVFSCRPALKSDAPFPRELLFPARPLTAWPLKFERNHNPVDEVKQEYLTQMGMYTTMIAEEIGRVRQLEQV
jgi:hypothetical protein